MGLLKAKRTEIRLVEDQGKEREEVRRRKRNLLRIVDHESRDKQNSSRLHELEDSKSDIPETPAEETEREMLLREEEEMQSELVEQHRQEHVYRMIKRRKCRILLFLLLIWVFSVSYMVSSTVFAMLDL